MRRRGSRSCEDESEASTGAVRPLAGSGRSWRTIRRRDPDFGRNRFQACGLLDRGLVRPSLPAGKVEQLSEQADRDDEGENREQSGDDRGIAVIRGGEVPVHLEGQDVRRPAHPSLLIVAPMTMSKSLSSQTRRSKKSLALGPSGASQAT